MSIRAFTLCASFLALTAYGQDPRGTITGVVADSSMASIPGPWVCSSAPNATTRGTIPISTRRIQAQPAPRSDRLPEPRRNPGIGSFR